MSTVAEIKAAVTQLSPTQRWELYQWLTTSSDIERLRLEALRKDVGIGLTQADRGELSPLEIDDVKAEVRRRLESGAK